MPETTITVHHAAGLHLRPAGLFVQTAARFNSTILITNLDRAGSPTVNAKTLMQVMKLGVAQGHRMHISAEGDDADAALAALEQLVASGFGLEDSS